MDCEDDFEKEDRFKYIFEKFNQTNHPLFKSHGLKKFDQNAAVFRINKLDEFPDDKDIQDFLDSP